MPHQGIARIIESALTDHAEALARTAPENDIDLLIADGRVFPDVITVDIGHAPADRRAVRKVKFVSGAMHGIVFHEGGDVETFLDRERLRYEAQLERYAAALGEPRTKLGLYFPLLAGWREWEGTE